MISSYTINNLATMKEETVNIKRLQQFISDEEGDLPQVAHPATQRFDPILYYQVPYYKLGSDLVIPSHGAIVIYTFVC